MTATRNQHSTESGQRRDGLYLALELGWNEWKLAFATGPRAYKGDADSCG